MWVVLSASIFGNSCRNNMVDFQNSKRVETTEAIIKVDAGLPAGRYVFQLIVIDESGNKSKPARINLKVTKRIAGPFRPRGSGLPKPR